MRYAGTDGHPKPEANEAIIVNSHDGASSDQLLCGRFRLCPAGHSLNTTAMDLLQAGVEQSVIALWLGHESIETTQIYLDANLELKERMLAKTTPPDGKQGRYRPDDSLLVFLRAL